MDFGAVGLEGLVGSMDNSAALASFASSDRETKQELYGSGFPKQERSGAADDDWRSSKLLKTTESLLLPQRNTSLKSQQQPQILSFSCPKSKALSVERSAQNATFPGFHPTSSAYSRSTGYNYGSFHDANINMHGVFTESRGPFTPSQWMELEHQALIYKYITAKVPIPSNLLNPIRKSLDSAAFSGYSGGLLRPNTLSWGTFHLGFSSTTDPEPGRCRRTDGKKWRCSRDAVADQKYCERHLNRGRHRSRKHVEGQSGHSAAAATTTTGKPIPTASSSVSASVVGLHGSGTSNSLGIAQHQPQLKDLKPDSSTPLSRMFLNKEHMSERLQESPGLSMSEIDLKSKDLSFFSKQQNSYQDSSQIEFGLVNSDSLLNPSQDSSSLFSSRNFCSSQDLTDQETMSQRGVHQFIEDWPKTQSDHSAVSLPQFDVQIDRTQLSISVPVAYTDLIPSTLSTNNEDVSRSLQRLSHDLDSIHMGTGLGIVLNEQNLRQANWISVPWEITTGGPLGEVLHNTNNSISECKNSSMLNLLAEGWDRSPQIGSSPTGVLQKTTFCSLSNSSTGSSPRAENKRSNEGASLCNDLGSILVHPSSLPASDGR